MQGDKDQLSSVFAALADSIRREILSRLAEGDATVSEIAEPFPVSIQAISKHLGVLERAGLITRTRQAQMRPCRLNPDALVAATDWIAGFRHLRNAQLDRLAIFLAATQDTSTTSDEGAPT